MIRNKGAWIGLALSALGIWLALRGIDWRQSIGALREAPWVWLALSTLIVIFAQMLRALRWQIAINTFQPVRYSNVFSAFMVGVFGLNVIPARVGEILRILALGRSESVSKSGLLATVVLERALDGVAILSIFGIGVALLPGEALHELVERFQKTMFIAIPAAFMVILGLLSWLARSPDRLTRAVESLALRFPAMARLTDGVKNFSEGLKVLADPRRMAVYVALSFLAWFLFAVHLYSNMVLLDLGLSFTASLIVLGFTVVGAMIPAAPGFVGTFHFFCVQALLICGLDKTNAATFAIVAHLMPYLANTLLGAIYVWRENVNWMGVAEA